MDLAVTTPSSPAVLPAYAAAARVVAALPVDAMRGWTVDVGEIGPYLTLHISDADGCWSDAPNGTAARLTWDSATGQCLRREHAAFGRPCDAADGTPAVQHWDSRGQRIRCESAPRPLLLPVRP